VEKDDIMKKEKKQKTNKYVVSRKILFLSILIGVPVLLLLIWFVQGFFGNKITKELKSKFEIDSIQYVKSSDVKDFDFNFEITNVKYATNSESGSITYKAEFTDHTNTDVQTLNMKVCVGDYWSHYVSDAKETSSITPTTSQTSRTGSISTAYKSKNGWGFDVEVNKNPNVYVYLKYTFIDSAQKKSEKSFVVGYEFKDIFTGSITA